MADEFSYNQKIKLFRDDPIEKTISFMMKVDDADYFHMVMPIINNAFQSMSENILKELTEECDKLHRDADLDFVESQLEELKVDFTYWIRSRCK